MLFSRLLPRHDAYDVHLFVSMPHLFRPPIPRRQVFEVKVTSRLKDSPAIISSHESGALRRMMRMVEQQNSGAAAAMPKQKIEINPK